MIAHRNDSKHNIILYFFFFSSFCCCVTCVFSLELYFRSVELYFDFVVFRCVFFSSLCFSCSLLIYFWLHLSISLTRSLVVWINRLVLDLSFAIWLFAVRCRTLEKTVDLLSYLTFSWTLSSYSIPHSPCTSHCVYVQFNSSQQKRNSRIGKHRVNITICNENTITHTHTHTTNPKLWWIPLVDELKMKTQRQCDGGEWV